MAENARASGEPKEKSGRRKDEQRAPKDDLKLAEALLACFQRCGRECRKVSEPMITWDVDSWRKQGPVYSYFFSGGIPFAHLPNSISVNHFSLRFH